MCFLGQDNLTQSKRNADYVVILYCRFQSTFRFNYPCLKLRDTRARAVRNVLGNVYLSSLSKNLWYEQREQLDSGGGGALSQGAGHDGSFYRYAV